MSEYIILEKSHLVGLANKVREVQGTTEEMTFNELVAGLNSGIDGGGIALDSELTRQEELIAELSSVLDNKAVSDIFSVISVTYPTGSTCACVDANGTTVEVASNSDDGQYGYALFLVDEIGTYTVSCFDGADYDSSENKKSETVEITAEGQGVSVYLVYRTEGYLYNNGVFNDDYEQEELLSKGTITYNEDSIYIVGPAGITYAFVVFKGVKFGGQTSITVNRTFTTSVSDGLTIAVMDDASAWNPTGKSEGTVAYGFQATHVSGNADFSLDISSVPSETYDVAVGYSTQGDSWGNPRTLNIHTISID